LQQWRQHGHDVVHHGLAHRGFLFADRTLKRFRAKWTPVRIAIKFTQIA
jgi:hypothetical protein